MRSSGTSWSRAVLALTFALFGVLKLSFSAGVTDAAPTVMDLLGLPHVQIYVAVLEVVLAVALLTRWWRPACWCAVSIVLMGTAAQVYLASTEGHAVSCGCLGHAELGTGEHLVLGAAILLLATRSLWTPRAPAAETHPAPVLSNQTT